MMSARLTPEAGGLCRPANAQLKRVPKSAP